MKNKIVYFLLASIIIISVSINLFWVFNYSTPFNYEDMIQLETTSIYINKEKTNINTNMDILHDLSTNNLTFKEIYFSKVQPVIPYLYYIGLKIFWHPFSPLIVNIFFSILLIYFTFLIGDIIHNKKVGLLSAFMVAFCQGILTYQRTVFDAFILTTLFTINFYLFLRSNYFKHLFWSILWALSASICLLARYSQLAYITTIFIIFFLNLFRHYIIKNETPYFKK
jgi:hypothetical protein